MKKLIDICELIVDCPHSTVNDEGEGYPLIRTPNIGKGRFILEGVHRVSKEVYEKRNARAIPQSGDLILAREAPAGNVAIIKNNQKFCLGQRTVLIRPDIRKVNPDYLVYYLLAPLQQHNLKCSANGSTVAHVNMPVIRNLKVDLPELRIQNSIASILSAFDDLIENNQKQIKLLEEAAQRFYKEWFVDLRFPGHENVKIIDGVPEGWSKKNIDDICDTIGGGTPSTKVDEYYRDGDIKWVTPTDVTKNDSIVLIDTEKKITEEGLNNSSAKLVPPFSILMTSRASVGYFAVCKEEVCTNQGFISCIPYDKVNTFYILHNLMNRVEEIRGKASGSTFLEISKKNFRTIELLMPKESIISRFNDTIRVMIEKEFVLAKSIIDLQEARDRLLPKLMSGEIEV